MQPHYRLAVEGQDITERIRPFLMALRLTDNIGFSADTLTLELSDTDNQGRTLSPPPRGRLLSVWLGYQESGLAYKGAFVVDELHYALAERVWSVQAQATDVLNGQAKVLRSERYPPTTLGAVLEAMAQRQGWESAIAPVFRDKALPALIQQDESDLHFLTRLGRLYGATAQVKHQHLVFVPKGSQQSARGRAMPTFELDSNAIADGQYTERGRGHYSGVRARYQGDDGQGVVQLGQGEVWSILRETFDSREQASDAAEAEWRRVQGETNTLSLTLAQGQPAWVAEAGLRLVGEWPAVIREQRWVISSVTHTLDDGLSTQAECIHPAALQEELA